MSSDAVKQGRSLVSVIIPAYNAVATIGETVRSAINQTWHQLEVIVIDDGSTDDTATMAKDFGSPSINIISQDNRGASAARNAGLRHAQGEYIQFLDADDILSPAKIELQIKALERTSKRSLASCSWTHFADEAHNSFGRREPVWTVSNPVDWLVMSLGGGGMMQTAAWLTPRSVIDDAGPWDESLSLHDDGEFFSRVLLCSDHIEFVPDAIVYYRSRADSLSRRRSRSAIESAYRVCVARDQMLRAVRDDSSSRQSVATQYAQFAYEFRSSAPDLTHDALQQIERLRAEPAPTVGGKAFRALHSRIGFTRALKIRSLIT